ncbi:MFS transporter [Permianibacter sp. IMCC34836]|uniref:MFS transporter n=1 Tax=Permianibacter fluminis TaxID=2738515 RepID=UPI0015541AC7|nr:MFS transporter [Permianibacter fluminis]NQD36141.1 MFS transporter [Permianibacter fluminis]
MSDGHQLALMRQRRFLPFFCTQFLGAFNDNLFKIALVLLVTYSGLYSDGQIGLLTNIANGLFILPFFLFSATFGQLADKLEKTILIRATKLLEISIMVIAAIGFHFHHMPTLLAALFLMGTHSTLFGPVKYGILPQHLHRDELIGGNGLIEMGTFVAIMLGQLVAPFFMKSGLVAEATFMMIGVAVIGYLTGRKVPAAPPTDPLLKINWNFITETSRLLKYAASQRVVFLAILGISWFWFYGAIVLAQMPAYAKQTLGGNEDVFALLLAMFTIGIAIGSLLCERLSQGRIEIGLVPFGSIGLTVFALDLAFASKLPHSDALLTVGMFIAQSGSFRILADLLLIGLFGGFYIVPLYTMVQTRTSENMVSRVIAANNVMNAAFMVVAAGLGAGLLAAGVSIPQLFLITALLNAAVVIYLYKLVPEFLLRFVAWILINTLYRLRESGMKQIPAEGPAVLVCNHVSFVDAIIIAAAVPRPVRFVMYHGIFKIPVLSWLFRTVKAIPIAPAKEDAAMKERALDAVAAALAAGEVVCIFPEGKITSDGNINEFRPGVEDIIKRTPVPVVPMALRGLWGSYFSRKDGAAFRGLPWKLWMKVELVAEAPLAPAAVSAVDLQQRVQALRGELA